MAGEKFIALEETSQEIKTAVGTVQTTADGIKTDTEGIKLSNDSIKAVADTILERLGLPTDVGGANTGSVFGMLNALLSSGRGISGFKYTYLKASRNTKTHKSTSCGVVIGGADWDNDSSGEISIDEAHGGTAHFTKLTNTSSSSILDERGASFIGFFTAEATITARSTDSVAYAYIFEFI